MNVCRRKRKDIALLALNAIAGEPARELRSHLETCPGCRQYLAEISNVTERIRGAGIENGIEASPTFHRKVVAALRRQEPRPGTFATTVQTLLSRWRVSVPVSLVLLAIAAALILRPGKHQSPSSMPGDSSTGAAVSSGAPKDVEPTISNYSAVANRSLEQFDELLTQQANKHFARFPVYTAGGVSDPSSPD
jgi:anti-sigma factor RsiW